MSNHPYGLRGDPFAPPATLSAKDASRLIRRRVRAFNGDGGALFPIETSDLIHELTGGVPDAILELAGKAMRVAAAEGAPAVSPAHVRGASVMTPDVASVEPATAAVAAAPQAPPDLEAARAVQAIDALIEAAEDAVRDDPTILPFDDLPALEAQAVEAAPDEHDTAVATADPDDEVGFTESIEDDDLPPFIPASIALPTQPSENLDPGEREWVSRFISTSGAGPVAGATANAPHAPTAHEGTPVSASPSAARRAPAAAGARPMPAGAHAPPGPRRRPRPPAPRKRRRSGNQGLLIAVAAVCIIAFVVRMSLRANLAPPGAGSVRPTPTSAPMVEPPASAPRPKASEPEPTPAREAAADREPAPAARTPERKETGPAPISPSRPAPPRTAAAPTPASGATVAPVEPPRRVAPAATFGLEVATFIFEERARVERERLAAAGLRARVVTTLEYGSRVYRVVLGGFPDPASAERAADSLLLNGVVLQARVIRVSEP